MVSFEGNKILSFYHEAKKLKDRELVVPRFVSVWLAHNCNLDCGYCYFASSKKRSMFIDTKSFVRLMNELKSLGTESIEFSGGGEPSLHRDCFIFSEIAKSIGLKVGMLTNGTVINKSRVGDFSYIRVGLDSVNKEMYGRLKGRPDMFDRVIDNIGELVKSRVEGCTRIGLKFMISKINSDCMEDMVKLGIDLGVDYVHMKPVHSSELELENARRIDSELEKLKREYGDFVKGSMIKCEAEVKCWLAPIHTVITTEGNVLVCCYFTEPEYVIGNINDSSFKDIWFSGRYWKVLDSITKEMCGKVDCRWNRYNSFMANVFEGKGDISFI